MMKNIISISWKNGWKYKFNVQVRWTLTGWWWDNPTVPMNIGIGVIFNK
jgi:hypothetical protein